MRFFRRDHSNESSAKAKSVAVDEAASATGKSSRDGGLISVTTGLAVKPVVPAATPSIKVAPVVVQHNNNKPKIISSSQQVRNKTSSRRERQPVASGDDEMLTNAFDNDDDHDHGNNNTSFNSKPYDSIKTYTTTTQQPRNKAALYQSHVNTLKNLKVAIGKVQQQILIWHEQTIICGRKALQAKKEDTKTKKIIITNECKLQLLRRKLYKINIVNAERQLIQLQQTQNDLEIAIRKLQQQPPSPQQQKITAPTADEEDDDILLPLEKELENINVVQEILSTDLKANLIPDDDDISVVEYNEEELLEELRTLATDDDITNSSNNNNSSSSSSNSSNQFSKKTTTKKKTTISKRNNNNNNSNKPDSSFHATLF